MSTSNNDKPEMLDNEDEALEDDNEMDISIDESQEDDDEGDDDEADNDDDDADDDAGDESDDDGADDEDSENVEAMDIAEYVTPEDDDRVNELGDNTANAEDGAPGIAMNGEFPENVANEEEGDNDNEALEDGAEFNMPSIPNKISGNTNATKATNGKSPQNFATGNTSATNMKTTNTPNAKNKTSKGNVQGNAAVVNDGDYNGEALDDGNEIDDEAGNGDTNIEPNIEEGMALDPNQSNQNFAERVTKDIHADTSAPQTNSASIEHLEPLATQNIDYQKPAITELKKNSAVEKKSTVHSAIPVGKMPIILTFETGRQKITIGELERIKAGYTFECGNPVNTPITICANDTPIGSGELLDIDGRIGVRIIEFYDK
jgi:flagellar motor switch/type III secretory pathway protein FliN